MAIKLTCNTLQLTLSFGKFGEKQRMSLLVFNSGEKQLILLLVVNAGEKQLMSLLVVNAAGEAADVFTCLYWEEAAAVYTC